VSAARPASRGPFDPGDRASAPGVPTAGAGDPTAAAVLVDDLVVRFDQLTAVGGVSFAVAPGEVFGLLGPNGAGKTTTIRVLTTLLAPSAGRALVAGHDVRTDSLAVRACIGYIPQAISVDGALTAYENLDFYGRVTGVPRRKRRERIAQAIETMELAHMLDRLARTLSGGMLRRLEIASALLNRPRVLFLDEPTVGLDPNARALVWERLAALREQSGTTILVTTHLMEEAERHCDRLGVIDRGRLIEQGEPAELIERHGVGSLEDVFRHITGRPLGGDTDADGSGDRRGDGAGRTGEEEGRLSDVRAQRRTARRLG
jgi:ABC-2 type transport system ATP-binding protein